MVPNPSQVGRTILSAIAGAAGLGAIGSIVPQGSPQLVEYDVEIVLDAWNRRTNSYVSESGLANIKVDPGQIHDRDGINNALQMAAHEAARRLVVRLSGGIPMPRSTAPFPIGKEPKFGGSDSSQARPRLSGEELRSLFSTELRARGDLPPVHVAGSQYTSSVIVKYYPDGKFRAIGNIQRDGQTGGRDETGTWEIHNDLLCMTWTSMSVRNVCAYFFKEGPYYLLYNKSGDRYGKLAFSSVTYQ